MAFLLAAIAVGFSIFSALAHAEQDHQPPKFAGNPPRSPECNDIRAASSRL